MYILYCIDNISILICLSILHDRHSQADKTKTNGWMDKWLDEQVDGCWVRQTV